MSRNQPFTYEEFKAIYSKVPRLCVDMVIKSDRGILLTLRQKNGWVGQWHLPGGTVFFQEGIEESLKRIAKEEIGVDIIVGKYLGHTEFMSEEKERGFGYSVSLVYLCQIVSGSLIKLDDQVGKFDFFKNLPEKTIYEHRQLIEKLIKDKELEL